MVAQTPKTPIQLTVGLGNPGAKYARTRHNAGSWFVQELANHYQISLHLESKFKGLYGVIHLENGEECKLLMPITYMNCSGEAIQAIAKFYKIPAKTILIAHDELDFPPGTIKIKFGGGDNGHNGIKDTIRHLKTSDFYRLRIGIGRPQNRDTSIDYVLNTPNKTDLELINNALQKAISVFPELVAGNMSKIMQKLHTK